jgi:hypothetical protein
MSETVRYVEKDRVKLGKGSVNESEVIKLVDHSTNSKLKAMVNKQKRLT